MLRPFVFLHLCVLSLLGCTVLPEHPTLTGGVLPTLLPVRHFVVNTDNYGGYQVSPDGTKLAWVAMHGARPRVFVKIIGRDEVTVLSAHSHEFRWAQDSRRLLLRKDVGGNENFHILLVDSEHPSRPLIDLTPLGDTYADIHQVIPSDPDRILVVHNHRKSEVFDLYRIDLNTRESSVVAENPGDVASWITDRRGVLRGRVRFAGERKWLELKQPGQKGWGEAYAWDIHDTVEIPGFTSDEEALWLLSSRGRDRVSLTRFEPKTGVESVVYEDSRVDVTQVHVNRLTGKLEVAYSYPNYPRTHVFDDNVRAELDALRKKVSGGSNAPVGVEIPSADDKHQVLIVSLYSHAGKQYYLWDRTTGKETFLGADAIHRHAADLAPVRPVAVQSRDGLTINGYLTLPQGVPAKKLPMVVLVHGGPWARNLWADPDWWPDFTRVQFLANRGYAVLQLNYRGSTGYGRKFSEAVVGEFGGKMQDDLLDGVKWATDQGIADPDKIAIMGGSYGGYAALVGLTFTPTVFACAIALVPPSDLVALIENFPDYWKHEMPKWHRYVGDPKVPEDRRRMTEKSPLFRAAVVQRPVLIIQGANDMRVNREQASQMAKALQKAGKQVDYVLIPGMGHVALHWPMNLKIYRKTEDFLAHCLGGRSSGFDFYELGSWAFPY